MNEDDVPSPRHLRLLTGDADRDPPQLLPPDRVTRSRAASGETSIRLLIAAGHALVRASYRALLEPDERIEVVGEAESGRQALALAATTAPDVALLDLELPDLHDLQATAAIVSHPALADVAVILIALSESDERVFSALRAGAIGVLSHDTGAADLIRALEVVASGQAFLPAAAVRRLVGELAPPLQHASAPAELDELTDREREVVALVGRGLSNHEIAGRLVISPATAKTHVSRAMVKLNARDRAKLAVIAHESGLVPVRTEKASGDAPG